MREARFAFIFDGERCTGCEACRIACGIANAGGADTGWRQVLTFNPHRHPALPTWHLSLACNHCDEPACLSNCPASAYRRDPRTGTVALQQQRCVGCRYCRWVCPWDAPRFDRSAGVMSKCTMCQERLQMGRQPACTEACPLGALSWRERGERGREVEYPPLPASGMGPALVLLSPQRPPAPPHTVPTLPPASPPVQPAPPRTITLLSEWSLVVFTVVMPALAAWWAAGVLRPERAPPLVAFLGLGAGALAASACHLGRPLRAWRALANLRGSWVSREVVGALALLGLGAASLLAPPGSALARSLGWAAVLVGAGLVIAVDGVYRVIPRLEKVGLHGGEATLAAPFLLAVLVGAWPVAMALGLGRSLLAMRRLRAGQAGVSGEVVAVRAALLAVACIPSLPWPAAAVAAVAGEALDRCDLLGGLEPVTPGLILFHQVGSRRPLQGLGYDAAHDQDNRRGFAVKHRGEKGGANHDRHAYHRSPEPG